MNAKHAISRVNEWNNDIHISRMKYENLILTIE